MHLIPEIINVDKFRAAMADALALYPTLSGRLVVSPSNERSVSDLDLLIHAFDELLNATFYRLN